jgi:hypothetical protein
MASLYCVSIIDTNRVYSIFSLQEASWAVLLTKLVAHNNQRIVAPCLPAIKQLINHLLTSEPPAAPTPQVNTNGRTASWCVDNYLIFVYCGTAGYISLLHKQLGILAI